ncbi:hypothetical protein VNO77_26827 [Canavalia gladiata]|uniref:Uncharacterized protein n=1 Tax=Canavalia gladiata TaxID=3824 RepID=A0AAN9KU97_CANGL
MTVEKDWEEGVVTIHIGGDQRLERVRGLRTLGKGVSGTTIGASAREDKNLMRVSPSEKRTQLLKEGKHTSSMVVVSAKNGESILMERLIHVWSTMIEQNYIVAHGEQHTINGV